MVREGGLLGRPVGCVVGVGVGGVLGAGFGLCIAVVIFLILTALASGDSDERRKMSFSMDTNTKNATNHKHTWNFLTRESLKDGKFCSMGRREGMGRGIVDVANCTVQVPAATIK